MVTANGAGVLLLALLGGMLTICSPCILPVIPLVFAGRGRSFWRDVAPLLGGLALAFTAAALIATTTARWLLLANEVGRAVALLLLAAVGLALLFEEIAVRLVQPVTRLGSRLLQHSGTTGARSARAMVVGIAIGLLWAPCAGPILGVLIAVGASGSAARATALYLAYAIGAVASLALLISLGDGLLARTRGAAVAERWTRRLVGVATLVTVAALASGTDRVLFARGGVVQTGAAEQALVQQLAPIALPPAQGAMPALDGGTEWLNSVPLSAESLRGKVVLVDFWTFACYNCLNALPHVKELYAKYHDRGFVVVGVHSPEFAHERIPESVRQRVQGLGITYPVVIDNDLRIWRAYHNQYWPAAYIIDARGQLRFHLFGEGRYDDQDRVVAQLLAERDAARAVAAK